MVCNNSLNTEYASASLLAKLISQVLWSRLWYDDLYVYLIKGIHI